MPAAFIARILREVSSMTDDPPTPGQLSRRMQVPEEDGDRFDRAIEQLVAETAKETGSPVVLKGFVRFALGEGVEKAPEGDFAAEVAKAAQG